MHNRRVLSCSLLILATMLATGHRAAGAQSTSTAFQPFPGGSAAAYHFDLARNFFPSAAAEAADRQNLIARLPALDDAITAGEPSPDPLLRALHLADSLDRQIQRHVAYLTLEYETDTRRTRAQRAADALDGLASAHFTTFDRALSAISDSQLVRLEQRSPELRRYHFSIESARRRAAHRLDDRAERVLDETVGLATTWGPSLFTTTLASIDFGTVETPMGRLSVARDYGALLTNRDERVRQEGYRRNESALALHRSTFAFILTREAASRNALSRLRHFADYPEESYYERYLDRGEVDALLNALGDSAALNKRIEHLIAEHLRRAWSLDSIHVWDLALPEPGMPAPRFTIVEATRIVRDAMRPLGDAYARELAQLLDPANGRLDVAPAPHRANRPGFSTGFVGFPSVFYQGTYAGYTDDIVTLAHESGHAVQNMLMDENDVLPRYAAGPAYFTESFAGLCELLVLQHLYDSAADRQHKIFYLQRLLTQGTEVFRTAWESSLEEQLFDSASAGRQLDADQIEALTQAIGTRFSSRFGPRSERRLAWIQPIQFYTRPLYRVNYVYSKLLALRYFELLRTDPAGFQARYLQLLRNGYDAPPDALLQRLVGVDLRPTELVPAALRVVNAWAAELQRLYATPR